MKKPPTSCKVGGFFGTILVDYTAEKGESLALQASREARVRRRSSSTVPQVGAPQLWIS